MNSKSIKTLENISEELANLHLMTINFESYLEKNCKNEIEKFETRNKILNSNIFSDITKWLQESLKIFFFFKFFKFKFFFLK
jgi:hypothetical protein